MSILFSMIHSTRTYVAQQAGIFKKCREKVIQIAKIIPQSKTTQFFLILQMENVLLGQILSKIL